MPETAWLECVRLARHVEKADLHGWHLAGRRIREQLAHVSAVCRGRVEQFERECEMGRKCNRCLRRSRFFSPR